MISSWHRRTSVSEQQHHRTSLHNDCMYWLELGALAERNFCPAINPTICKLVSLVNNGIAGTARQCVSVDRRSNDGWSWAHFYSHPMSTVSCDAHTHCLLANVRIFCWLHKKITCVRNNGETIHSNTNHSVAVLSKIILSTSGIPMNRPKLGAEGAIVSHSIIIINEIRKFCLKANVDNQMLLLLSWCATAKMPNHCTIRCGCVRVNYGTTRSLFYMSMCGTFITPVSTIFASTGDWMETNGFLLVAANFRLSSSVAISCFKHSNRESVNAAATMGCNDRLNGDYTKSTCCESTEMTSHRKIRSNDRNNSFFT